MICISINDHKAIIFRLNKELEEYSINVINILVGFKLKDANGSFSRNIIVLSSKGICKYEMIDNSGDAQTCLSIIDETHIHGLIDEIINRSTPLSEEIESLKVLYKRFAKAGMTIDAFCSSREWFDKLTGIDMKKLLELII